MDKGRGEEEIMGEKGNIGDEVLFSGEGEEEAT